MGVPGVGGEWGGGGQGHVRGWGVSGGEGGGGRKGLLGGGE